MQFFENFSLLQEICFSHKSVYISFTTFGCANNLRNFIRFYQSDSCWLTCLLTRVFVYPRKEPAVFSRWKPKIARFNGNASGLSDKLELFYLIMISYRQQCNSFCFLPSLHTFYLLIQSIIVFILRQISV